MITAALSFVRTGPGMMVLFPGYMLHTVFPHQGEL
jgi:hypothetical protein